MSCDQALAKDPLIHAPLQEHTLSAQGGATHVVKKAPRSPIAFVMPFELTVCDSPRPRFFRMMACDCLIRLWISMRYADHRGMLPRLMHRRANGLHATLVRTKTSGVRRRREELFLVVDPDSFGLF